MLCSNTLLNSSGQLSWDTFAPQREQGKLTTCARRVLSLCSSHDIAIESILPKDALSYLTSVGAGGGVASVARSLGELGNCTEWMTHGNCTGTIVQFKMQARAGSSVKYIDHGANRALIALLMVSASCKSAIVKN